MTLRRKLINLLDRPGGRTLLAWIGTLFFRKLTGKNVAIFWDQSWFSRDGLDYVSDSMRFNYFREGLLNRKSRIDQMRENGRDYWFYKYQPKLGDVIVDIGAGSGHEMAIFAQPLGDSGLVVAVEAHPVTCERLEKTCRYNKYKNVFVRNLAITDRAGTVSIEDTDHDEANAVTRDPGTTGFPVEGMTLDELCEELQIRHIDFLKMNIEGAEQWAILGMNDVIKRTDFVAIACHDFRADHNNDERFCTRERIRTFLLDNGFNVVDRADDIRPYVRDHIHGWRSTPSNSGDVQSS